MTTWRQQIEKALMDAGETWADLESITLTDRELDREFNEGYGGTEGVPFTAWTPRRVYFPAVYDGAEWVVSVPRHPNGEATPHVGGE